MNLPNRGTVFRIFVGVLAVCIVAGMSAPALASTSKTPFPDDDGNGYPNDGHYVTGVYDAYYYEDASGDWYQDLGDGRTRGTVDSVEDLDQSTLTTCTYRIQYRADFGNDPFMDDGWIRQTIHCKGHDGNSVTTYLIVSDEDRRYSGDEDRAVWGSWEYVVMTFDGEGNVANPVHPEYYFED